MANTPRLKPKATNYITNNDFAQFFNTDDPTVLFKEIACRSYGEGKCPLTKGQKITYVAKTFIEDPPSSVTFFQNLLINTTFSLVDDNDTVHVCYQLKVEVY